MGYLPALRAGELNAEHPCCCGSQSLQPGYVNVYVSSAVQPQLSSGYSAKALVVESTEDD